MDVVVVDGEEIQPEDFGEGAGWCSVRKTKQADGASKSAQKQQPKMQQATAAASTTGIAPAAATAAYYKKRCARQLRHLAKASQMPELPPDDFKIIVRPRDGFNGAEYGMDRPSCCLRNMKHIDVCYECGRLKHRSDVCTNPQDKICRGCGSNNPPSDHRCEPRCQLCGKGHLTEDRSCKARYKTPYIVKRRQLERRRREEEEAAEVYGSTYNCSAYHYDHYPSFDNNSCNASPTRRSTSRDVTAGRGKRWSRSRSRTPTPRSTLKTRGGADPGTAAFNQGTQSLQHRMRRQPQQGHMNTGQQVRWAGVASFPVGGVASADRSLGPAVGGGGGSELKQAIEPALEQPLGPLQSIISELKRKNAILKAENSMLKGEAPQSQPSQQQVTSLPLSSLRSSTSTRPEVAEMDTNDKSSSGEEAHDRDDHPCTAKRIALDPARPEQPPRQSERYEQLQKRIDIIENSLDERFANHVAQMNDMLNSAITKLSEQMAQMLTAHVACIENIEARLPLAGGRPIRTINKPYARQQPHQQQQNTLTDAETPI
ncbi:hypothetical protein HPB51_021401 [Rhipicephalus microplus]|uniref:CCHC-type domain-containing protein n=1 Tax=Rhipicephalus microplus TaxID=6941 RepID=A0A9J6F8Y3_RHIMP|nr:hypothetical protein HPB51_021401 [Rhipicephalus microplus]